MWAFNNDYKIMITSCINWYWFNRLLIPLPINSCYWIWSNLKRISLCIKTIKLNAITQFIFEVFSNKKIKINKMMPRNGICCKDESFYSSQTICGLILQIIIFFKNDDDDSKRSQFCCIFHLMSFLRNFLYF